MRLGLAAAVAALALAAAGCGGSGGSGGDPIAAWAGGLCSALTAWTTVVETAGTTIRASPSAESLPEAVSDVVAATETLAGDLRSLGQPETEAGQQTEETLTGLADSLQAEADTLSTTVEQATAGGLTGLLEAVPAITGSLGAMVNAVGQSFSDLEALDTKGEIERAFNDAESCTSFSQ